LGTTGEPAGSGRQAVLVNKMMIFTLRQARRLIVAVVGATVLLAGVVMIVTPGPAVIVIPLGLAILATEFAWAHRLLRRVREKVAGAIKGEEAPAGKAEEKEGGGKETER
jgi:uncharacterized protein (TIGR02611 family)